jgi:glycosyltransferase involved in cell wall biosynthesis
VSAALPVTVVVPTIGRPELLEACLASLAACEPRADEVLVLDQSGGDSVRSVVNAYASAAVRVLTLCVANKSLALNLGLEQARHDAVLMTDDDCTVAPSWVAVAWSQLERDPEAMVTGRVLPGRTPLVPPRWRIVYSVASEYKERLRLSRSSAWRISGSIRSNDSRPGSSSAKLKGRGRGSGRCQRGDRPGSRAAL